MACLFKRNNGVFYIVSSKQGERKWMSLRTTQEVEARETFREFVEEENRRRHLRLSVFSEDYLASGRLTLAQSTVSLYRASFSHFIRLIGDKPLKRVTPVDIERYKVLRAKEVALVTVNIDLRTLRAAFNHARHMRLIDQTPFEGVKLLRIPEGEAPFLIENEIRRLLMVISDQDFKSLVIFDILTMIRLGELVHLEWSDIDLERREIRIRNKNGFRVKGGKPRTVPMNNWVYEFLLKAPRRSSYVFSKLNGFPHLRGSISHKFKKYVRRSELDDRIHFHSLRHTGISLLVNLGVPQPFVQRLAGHSSMATTAIYTHLEDRNLVSAVNSFPSFN